MPKGIFYGDQRLANLGNFEVPLTYLHCVGSAL
jgi:hypothetical protein